MRCPLFRDMPSTAVVASSLLLASLTTQAQTIVGPSPPTIVTTITVNADETIVVGGTNITTPLTTPATNVTGGTLTLDATTGPTPGPIIIQTASGHALLVNGGGVINVVNGASITTTGLGSGLVAIGAGSIDATNISINNTGTTTGGGYGAVAQSGATINLRGSSSIATGQRNAVGVGAAGANSSVTLNALTPITMNGAQSTGIYLHDGGQVFLPENSTITVNGVASSGVVVDNTTVTSASLRRGLVIDMTGANPAPVGVTANSGTGLVVLNGAGASLDAMTVRGNSVGTGVVALSGRSPSTAGDIDVNANASVSLSDSSINVAAVTVNPVFYVLSNANLVTPSGNVSGIFSVTASSPAAGLRAIPSPNARTDVVFGTSTITASNTQVNVAAANGVGAAAGAPGNFGLSTINLLDNSAVTTTGTASIGLQANPNARIEARDSTVTTSGGGRALDLIASSRLSSFLPAVPSNTAPTIELVNTNALGTGAGTDGMQSVNFTSNLVNQLTMTNSSTAAASTTPMTTSGICARRRTTRILIRTRILTRIRIQTPTRNRNRRCARKSRPI